MARPEKVRLTMQEFLRIPESQDGRRFELYEGELVVTASPFLPHGEAVTGLFRVLDRWVQAHAGGLLIASPSDVLLSDDTALVPDLFWIAPDRVPQIVGDRVTGPPDLVVEVLSPSTAKRDRTHKADLYAQLGVREYWIADRKARSIEILVPRRGRMVRHALAIHEQSIASSLDPHLTVRPVDVFRDPNVPKPTGR